MKVLTKIYLGLAATGAVIMQAEPVQKAVIAGLDIALHSHPALSAIAISALTAYLAAHNPKKPAAE